MFRNQTNRVTPPAAAPKQRPHIPPAPDQRPVFDLAYIRRLRTRMRASVLAAEAAGADWRGLDKQHKELYGHDDGLLYIKKKQDTFGLDAAWSEYTFNRDQALMYAAVISAEESAQELLAEGMSQ